MSPVSTQTAQHLRKWLAAIDSGEVSVVNDPADIPALREMVAALARPEEGREAVGEIIAGGAIRWDGDPPRRGAKVYTHPAPPSSGEGEVDELIAAARREFRDSDAAGDVLAWMEDRPKLATPTPQSGEADQSQFGPVTEAELGEPDRVPRNVLSAPASPQGVSEDVIEAAWIAQCGADWGLSWADMMRKMFKPGTWGEEYRDGETIYTHPEHGTELTAYMATQILATHGPFVQGYRAALTAAGAAPEGWIDRAARCAEEILRGPLADVPADEAAPGIQHVAWMCMKLAAKDVGSDTKTCRWLGYAQGALVSLGYSTLETEKQRNLRSAAAQQPGAQHGQAGE